MKKMSKIVSIILIAMVLISVTTNVMAAMNYGVKPGNITGQGNVNTEGLATMGNNIVKVLGTIGIVVSVAVLIVLGIKYMMGSAEEKAEYKKTLIPYVIGAALIFGASSIATMVANFTEVAQ